MIDNKNKFRVKLKSKGYRRIHKKDFKSMSFKVDIKGEKRYQGMEEFSLQIPTIRNYTFELFAAKLMKKENITVPRHKYVKLFVNGEYFGIRHIEESISKELIEASKKRYGPVFSLNVNTSNIFEKSDFELSDKQYWEEFDPQLASQARILLKNIREDNKTAEKNFDMELWSKYFALSDSLGIFHGLAAKSVKFYLNPVTGKIEPIFLMVIIGALKYKDIYIGNFFNESLKAVQIPINHFFARNIFLELVLWKQVRTKY